MKVAVIAPIAPWRGGIARHSTALARALAAYGPGEDGAPVSVSAISFARLYPAALYPGEDARAADGAAPSGFDTVELLDSVNPLSWRRTVRAVLAAGTELAVIPAWTFFTAPALGYVAGALRRAGVEVVAVVHNAEDHEAAAWKSALTRWQLRRASRFVTHNAALAAALARVAPGIPVAVAPHPLYDDYPAPRGALPRRAPLELLFFGLVRPYKGLDVLLEAMAQDGLLHVRLTVAGEIWSDADAVRARIAALGIADRVELIPRWVPDAEAAELFARCDVMVAPYLSASGSGALALAQWFGRPAAASDLPAFREAIDDGATGWLFPAGDAAALAALLRGPISRRAAADMAPALIALRETLSWRRFARTVLTGAG